MATEHVVELQENLLDEAHFVTIHRCQDTLVWAFESRGARARATAKMKVGYGAFGTYSNGSADFFGPGMIVLRTKGPIEHTVLSMGTPIDAEKPYYRVLFATKKDPGLGSLTRILNDALRCMRVSISTLRRRLGSNYQRGMPTGCLVRVLRTLGKRRFLGQEKIEVRGGDEEPLLDRKRGLWSSVA